MFKSSSFSLVFLTAALFCSGVSAQGPVFRGRGAIVSVESSKCLTVRESKFANGTPVEMQTCDESAGQEWVVYHDGVDPSGLYVIRLADEAQNFCVAAKTIESPSKVTIQGCNKYHTEKWDFDYGVDGPGAITLWNSGELCLDLPGHSKENGVQVETYACNGGKNQQWTLVQSEQ